MRRMMQEIARDFIKTNPTPDQHILFLEAIMWDGSDVTPLAKRLEILQMPAMDKVTPKVETADFINGTNITPFPGGSK